MPVLLQEVIQAFGLERKESNLSNKSKDMSRSDASLRRSPPIYLDGTLGGVGHALAMAKALDGNLTIIGLDRDPQAISRARETLKGKAERIILENEDYRNLDKVLEKASTCGILSFAKVSDWRFF